MKKRTTRTVSLILCIIMTISLFTVVAFADSKAESLSGKNICVFSDESIQEEAICTPSDEMQRKEHEANEKYNVLLREWAFDPQYISDTHADFPDFYGGAYIDDEKNLVIQVTSLDDSVVAYFASIIDLDNVIFEEVKYSFIELMTEYNSIVEQFCSDSKKRVSTNISGVGISCKDNSINLHIISPDKDSIGTYSTEEINIYISDFENIEIIMSDEQDKACALVEPGDEMFDSYTKEHCSAGFWACDNNDNVGIVTAPHDTIFKGDTIKVGDRVFGTAGQPYNSGKVDAVFVKRTNTYFTPLNYVSGWDFELKSNAYEIPAQGTTLYSKGYTSGCMIGEVTETSYTTSYGISDCIVVDSSCTFGDSGGIVAGGGTSSSRYTVGIISGVQGATGNMICVKASNITRTLGVYVY